MLRDYQQRALDQLYNWFESGKQGNPCLVMPTGSGKSHIIAALCKDALTKWPETRVLMLTHVKELIEQNHEKMLQHWPDAPVGIYSASIGRKELGEPITFAGIQSVRSKGDQIGYVNLVIIDEAHTVSHKDTGGYRTLLNKLTEINPDLRVVGLTASPYRLGHGMITEKPAIFDDLIEPVTIEELVANKYLSTLRSKVTEFALDVSNVHKRNGEYIESELQAAVDTKDQNERVVREVLARAGDRKAWLFFCVGVAHAHHIANLLCAHGVPAACVTGDTPKAERERIIDEFKAGKLRALTNANVLTTGFDYPDIDLIAMLRPTMSPGLYVQMAGRGLRPKSHIDHCLVLDFAGNVSRHGPITKVKPPSKGTSGEGEAPAKPCPECHEIVHLSAKTCPSCGYVFPPPAPKNFRLHDDDIMGRRGNQLIVKNWQWRKHISKASGKEMVAVTYYGKLHERPITEFFPVTHEGFVGQRAIKNVLEIATRGNDVGDVQAIVASLEGMVDNMNKVTPPIAIEYKREGRYERVVRRIWV